MKFIDKNRVIKCYDIPNVYLPNCILVPCNSEGSSFGFDSYDSLTYYKGRIESFISGKPLRKVNPISAYYRVDKLYTLKEDL